MQQFANKFNLIASLATMLIGLSALAWILWTLLTYGLGAA